MKPFLAAALVLASPSLAFAHAGGLDSNGCHMNRAENTYQCHQGPLKGQSFKSKAEAESRMGHAQGAAPSKAPQQTSQAPEPKGKAKEPAAPAQTPAKRTP